MPGARAVRGWSVTAAQLLEGTFGLSLSKASAHQHNHDVEQLLESLSKGSSPPIQVRQPLIPIRRDGHICVAKEWIPVPDCSGAGSSRE